MQIIFDPEKAIQTKLKFDTEIIPAHNKIWKAENRSLACRLFFLFAPMISAIIFIVYNVFYMALTNNWAIANLISENYWNLIAVFASSLTLAELFALVLFFLFKVEKDFWWGPDNYPAAVKYHLAIEKKTILKTTYNCGYIDLTLEDPATHIVTNAEIDIRHFVTPLRSDITEQIIDLHEEVAYRPYMIT